MSKNYWGCASACVGRLWLGPALTGLLLLLVACSDAADVPPALASSIEFPATDETAVAQSLPAPNPDRNAYFGDLHVHTRYSFDAFIFGTVANPDDAYRYAQGQSLEHPSGFKMQMPEPLDFYGVRTTPCFSECCRPWLMPAPRCRDYP